MKQLIKDVILQTRIQLLFLKKEKITALLILTTLLFIFIMNINQAECMQTPEEKASLVVNQLEENNSQGAQELLDILSQQNLTPNQILELDILINQELQNNPANIYGVHQGNLHNTGNPLNFNEDYSVRSFTWRDIALALTIATIFTMSLYLVYRYWDDIRNVLFGSPRTIRLVARTVTNPVQIALIRRLELVPTHQFSSRFLQLAVIIITRDNPQIEE